MRVGQAHHLIGALEQQGVVLRLQFALNLFPFSFFILEEDPGSEVDTKIDER